MASLLRMNMLPEDCVSNILSLTSPADACRSSSASSSLRSAADSDIVWDSFLPSDYREVLARSVTPLKFSSKKELFFQLSESILVDGGIQSFSLDKSCGRKSYTLSARALSIPLSNEPMHWNWKSIPESRFSEVIELKTISRLEIQGTIHTEKLSPNTMYGAYLIIKISDRAFGLDSIPSEISLSIRDHVVKSTGYLRDCDSRKQQMGSLFYTNRMQMLKKRVVAEEGSDALEPRKREDGWMEIELGEFLRGERGEAVAMSLMEVKGHQLKGGLIIEGIEVRPKE